MGPRRPTAPRWTCAALPLLGCATATRLIPSIDDAGTPVDRPVLDAAPTPDLAPVATDLAPVATDLAPVATDLGPGDVPPEAAVMARPLRVAQRDLVVTPVGSVRQPSLCFHPGSDAFVTAYTWVLPGAPDPRFRVEARALVVGPDGSLAVGAPLLVDGETPAHDAGDPEIAAPDRADLPALAVWIDDRSGPGARGSIEVYGRFLRPTGGPAPSVAAAGEPFDVSQHPGGDEALPAVAWDASAGTFLVAWADDRERGVRAEDARVVYARTVAPDGRVGPELRVGDEMLFQTNPSVASCGDGRFLVAWTDYRREGSTLVSQARGRLIDARTGEARSEIRRWGEAPGLAQDLVASRCAPERDGWWVAWGVNGPPTIRQIRAARLAGDGSVRALLAMSTTDDGARAPRLAPVPATGQVLLTHLAQESYNGYALSLDAASTGFPAETPLTPAPPRLGTFWSAVAASTRDARAVAVMTLDYDRLHATTFAP